MAEETELDRAMQHFAQTYQAGIGDCEWDEACDMAETVAKTFRNSAPSGQYSDDAVAMHLYTEAVRYEDM